MTDISMHSSIEAAAAAWLARRDSGERWTDEDEAALRMWIAESAAHRVAWLRLESAWQRTERMPALARASDAPRRPARFQRPATVGWALAASLVLAVGIAWISPFNPWGAKRYQTEVGNLETVTLADGSRVTLNTDTRGRAIMNGSERRFWLEQGEAFFEVEHDASRPFVVVAGRDTVTVLGTRFSVRHENDQTSVTVAEGRVRLDPANGGVRVVTPITLTRNEAAVANAGSVLVTDKTDEQVKDALSWRQGRLAFKNMTLAEVAAEFNRYNRVRIEVRGDAAAVRVSGSFESNNFEGFTRLADEGLGLSTLREGDRIVIEAE
jgi:transmembrane sensor